MATPKQSNDSYNTNLLFSIQIILAQYPILQDRIIDAMLNRLAGEGFLTFNEFEIRARDFAVMSQKREGLQNPFGQEAPNVWELRLQRVRAQLISVEFSQHYTLDDFSRIVENVVQNRVPELQPEFMWHNLQYSNIDTIIDQALEIERLPLIERERNQSKMMGAKTALIRRLISDQLPYLEVAKKVFTIWDLIDINKHRIGKGCIGGKAAGMLLAHRILQNAEDAEIRSSVMESDTYFIGAEEFYTFLSFNDQLDLLDLRYDEEIVYRQRYPEIVERFKFTHFPKEIVDSLSRVINEIKGKPFIVRSSSMLEEDLQHSLTGYYGSHVIPNQGTTQDALNALMDAIRSIYAGVFDPKVLNYRKRNGLIDFPESIAVLIQVITGCKTGNFFFPDIAGTGSSKSPFRWRGNLPMDLKDEGYLRLVCGMGTRAVNRTATDFTQIVVLNDPEKTRTVFSVDEPEFAQSYIDLINLKTNKFESLEIPEVINEKYALFPLIVQTIEGGKLRPVMRGVDPDGFVINFDELIRKSDFTKLMRDILATLEKAYRRPVMIEFTMGVDMTSNTHPAFQIQIDKFRPISQAEKLERQYTFEPIPEDKVFLKSDIYVMNGFEKNIRYIVTIHCPEFNQMNNISVSKLQQFIRKLDERLGKDGYILMSNGRLGVKQQEQGVPITLSEFPNARAVVEVSDSVSGENADPMAGTNFFQNLQEAGIYVISINRYRDTNFLDDAFFAQQPNQVRAWVEDVPESLAEIIQVFPVMGYKNARQLKIALNRAEGHVTAYFE